MTTMNTMKTMTVMPRSTLARELLDAIAASAAGELAPAALTIARLAYPGLEPARYLDRLDELGHDVAPRAGSPDPQACIAALNHHLFDTVGLTGNRTHYNDPRNSFLNDVLERRTGIPISLGVVYIEVARRIGLPVRGVNFPGHFLLTCQTAAGPTVLDPFAGGAVVSPDACRRLWVRHVGADVEFDSAVLAPASTSQVIVRMLHNLKRLFVEMRAFPQARTVMDLLVAVDPSVQSHLRDRGLVSYHLKDFSAALKDLDTYLLLAKTDSTDEDARTERAQLWEHVTSLRQRVASFN